MVIRLKRSGRAGVFIRCWKLFSNFLSSAFSNSAVTVRKKYTQLFWQRSNFNDAEVIKDAFSTAWKIHLWEIFLSQIALTAGANRAQRCTRSKHQVEKNEKKMGFKCRGFFFSNLIHWMILFLMSLSSFVPILHCPAHISCHPRFISTHKT